MTKEVRGVPAWRKTLCAEKNRNNILMLFKQNIIIIQSQTILIRFKWIQTLLQLLLTDLVPLKTTLIATFRVYQVSRYRQFGIEITDASRFNKKQSNNSILRVKRKSRLSIILNALPVIDSLYLSNLLSRQLMLLRSQDRPFRWPAAPSRI